MQMHDASETIAYRAGECRSTVYGEANLAGSRGHIPKSVTDPADCSFVGRYRSPAN